MRHQLDQPIRVSGVMNRGRRSEPNLSRSAVESTRCATQCEHVALSRLLVRLCRYIQALRFGVRGRNQSILKLPILCMACAMCNVHEMNLEWSGTANISSPIKDSAWSEFTQFDECIWNIYCFLRSLLSSSVYHALILDGGP